MEKRRIIPKWGFGMAPISDRMRERYDSAVQTALDFLQDNLCHDDVDLDHISELKGMFNRCLRQDQWDWFSVHTELGAPQPTEMNTIAGMLLHLRQGLQAQDARQAEQLKRALLNVNLLAYLRNWQEGVEHTSPGNDCGWIYILSTRERPDELKIGMTTRSVAERVKEINRATGLLWPFSARRVFRVINAAVVEQEIFRLLEPYRARTDREFFLLSFREAVRVIRTYIEESRMRVRERGKVIWFNTQKHHGFIAVAGSDDVFLHASQLDEGESEKLIPGAEVEFDLAMRGEGRCALNVRVIVPEPL